MGRVGVGHRRDAYAALIVAGMAMAVGGAALFGIVAHTKTPFSFKLSGKAVVTAPPDSLSPGESVVALKPPEPGPALRVPPPAIPAAPRLDLLATGVEAVVASPVAPAPAPPAIAFQTPLRGETIALLGKAAASALNNQTHPRVQPFIPAEPVVAQTPAEPPRVEVKVAEVKPVEPTRVEVKVVEAKRTEVKLASFKVPAPKIAIAPKQVVVKAPEPRRVETKAAVFKFADAKRNTSRSAMIKVAETTNPEPKRTEAKRAAEKKAADAKRAAEAKAAEAKLADAKRAADEKRAAEAKAAETKLADARRAAEKKAADLKLAQSKRAAEAKLAETRLAETKRAAAMKEEEAKIAEAKHAAEMKEAEADLARTRQAAEMKAAEAKLAEAKLAQTLVETKLAEAKLADTRHAAESGYMQASDTPRYGSSCDSCGTITSVGTRNMYGRNVWEVRVSFTSGGNRSFIYPADPGVWNGERVRLAAGKLYRM